MTDYQRQKTGGPAFPNTSMTTAGGMSLRDWFAGMAMQGLLANAAIGALTFGEFAARAWKQADAMLATRGHERDSG